VIVVWVLGCVTGDGHDLSPEPVVEDTGSPAVVCPPPEPYGRAIGDHAEDVEATTCAGDPRSLHGFCGSPTLITSWYGWCPSCRDNAALARELADENATTLHVAVVLEEDPLGHPVDADLCDEYIDAYPSAAAAWMDPDLQLDAYGTTDLVLVLAADGSLTFVRQTATEDAIRAAVEAVLAGG
jgi:hypothetical protein